ncbi:phage tail-collar fiber domain-containing protein [Enterobacter cloacae]|uniref:phage tail-collar fiber domain-containing protein n=1 Tax=Enterobacter cloacae TaxID=550 RepID=UPI000ADF9C8F|nr:phage tail protein [Enterobacter cloacae]
MSQTAITQAFEQWKASQAVTGEPVLLDEFVFANVPGLDASKPIDRSETLPPAAQIVHRQVVSRKGVVNENAVVHSVVLGAEVGDFSFNWIGLINKASNTLAMIVHAPLQQKLKTKDGQQGNVLTRSFLMEYNGAQTETGINTPAETWQIDFTARMAAMDERQRLENIDLYGAAAFLGNGYLVAKSGSQYYVTAGAGYVRGLRAQLAANQNITVAAKPVNVWLDVAWTGTLTSAWGVTSKITVAANQADYVQNGVQHYVFAVASIDASGNITDLRPKGTLNEQAASDALKKHEQSRNHPDATTAAKGFTQLSSALDSVSESLAATPKAVKAANDNANGRVPSGRKINGRALTGDINVTAQDIFNGQTVGIGGAADLNTFTIPGLYYQPANAQAQTGSNYPEANAGSLEVYKHAGITQIYRIYNSSRSYIRTLYSGVWSAWTKQYDAANKPTPADIGAVAKSGDSMSGSLIQDSVPQETYNYTALATGTTGVKNYLRKFRGGSGDTIWHETAQGGEYRIATGNTDGQEEFGISTATGVRARGNITSQTGALYSGTSKKLGILSTGQSEKNATLRLWGSADRPTIVELGDDSGYHYYSQRNANGSIAFQFNGSAGFGGGITSSGEIISRNANGLRIAYGNYGTFWRNDGGNLFLMITNSGDQLGSYNSLRPFVVNLASGDVTINKLALANYASFDARYYTKAQSDAGYMAKTGAYTKTESDGRFQPKGSYTPAGQAYTKAESDSRYITQVRLGSVTSSGQIGNANLNYGNGIVLTGIYGSANYTVNLTVYYRQVQYLINGKWYTAASA